ncbi:hypothetical protein RZR75_22785, partial [Enterobacter hormaechei]|uniref:hypothetical protein n=1 Tax=Enterobacter hormaechei TaxID=158836 RepID=UPI00292AFF34
RPQSGGLRTGLIVRTEFVYGRGVSPVSPKLTELTASLNKTKKVLGVKGLKYPSKEKMLSVGELESEVLL